jgi:hypothetical protein
MMVAQCELLLSVYIVTCRPVSRQHLKYAHATIKGVLEEEFSMYRHILTREEVFYVWSAPCPVLVSGPIDTHSDT